MYQLLFNPNFFLASAMATDSSIALANALSLLFMYHYLPVRFPSGTVPVSKMPRRSAFPPHGL